MLKPIYTVSVLTTVALALSGCASTDEAQAVSISERLCSIDSLRAERNESVRSAYGLANLTYDFFDPDGEETERDGDVIVENAPFGDGSEITRLIRAYELDLDAAYRFASTSCQAYTMCMQMNANTESNCNMSLDNWQNAQERFVDTSNNLGEIRESISRQHLRNQADDDYEPDHHGGGHSHDHHAHSDYDHHDDHKPSCRSSLTNILSVDACSY